MKDSVTGHRPSTKRKVADGVPKTATPVFTVNTREEASLIQVSLCKLQYDGRYVMWPEFSGKLEDVPAITTKMRDLFKKNG